MLLLNPEKLDATLYVEASLARALEMHSTKTTPRSLANYVSEQAGLTYFQEAPHAIRYLVSVALALSPPESDRHMDFPRRAEAAARDATPHDYGAALSTLVELGWGGLRLDDIPVDALSPGIGESITIRDVGERIRAVLFARTLPFALRLLERWESEGHITRLKGRSHG